MAPGPGPEFYHDGKYVLYWKKKILYITSFETKILPIKHFQKSPFWIRALDSGCNDIDGVTICSDVSKILSTYGHFVGHRYNFSNQ